MTEEQAAVLALTRATAGPWHHTARVVEARGSALRLARGDLDGLGQYDRAHAARVVARLRPGDLGRAGVLIASCPAALVTVLDDDYPGNLACAHNLQPFLWVRGRLGAGDHRSVAVTGDAPGARAAARALAAAGLTVVCDAPRTAVAAATAGGRAILVGPDDGRPMTGGPGALGVVPDDGRPMAVVGGPDGGRQGGGGAGAVVVVSPFWPGTGATARTRAVTGLVTSGLAAALYVTGACDGERAAMALSQGKHVFAAPGLPWTPRLAYRGGVTVVAGIDELARQAVNLVDVTRLTTVF
ncbi:hypothetical protein ABT158_04750 [Nonomuraea sp. NPDC001636]|uniref:hypothetical protein n=1 Tax=Nonomuraea sp. NPDC001636 TaxID=3154391 RepID=UPI003322D48B